MGKRRYPNPVINRIDELMKDGEARTAAQIARILDARTKYVRDQLAISIAAGLYHAPFYVRHARAFRYGPGENAPDPGPVRLTNSEYSRIYRQRKREEREAKGLPAKPQVTTSAAGAADRRERDVDDQFRTDGAWWPAGDPVITAAIQSMARVGR